MKQILSLNSTYKQRKIYLFIFFISIFMSISILLYLLYSFYIRLNQSKQTALLKNKYSISTLYPQSNTYTTLKVSNTISTIGLIQIPKINVNYPIIQNTNEDLLKISVCRFSGPLPNRIGNLCIAGHNYKNNTMFSNLYKLNIGDSFFITDLNNTKLEYIIYNKFNVDENNLSCIQDSNNVEVTLITCNNLDNSKRTIIKAKMKG